MVFRRKAICVFIAMIMAATMTLLGVTPASAQPLEVWVDDDWAGSNSGDLADGHIFGTDAFATIQDGVDTVTSPGTVRVAAGIYYENITLKDGVEVLGAGADVTTIDGSRNGPVVTANNVGSEAKLDGFTITNGNYVAVVDIGADEYCPGASVDISVVLQGGSRTDEGWVVPVTIKFFSPGADVLSDSPVDEFNLTTTKSGSAATCQCISVMPDT